LVLLFADFADSVRRSGSPILPIPPTSPVGRTIGGAAGEPTMRRGAPQAAASSPTAADGGMPQRGRVVPRPDAI